MRSYWKYVLISCSHAFQVANVRTLRVQRGDNYNLASKPPFFPLPAPQQLWSSFYEIQVIASKSD